jgi:hypothetical protein
VLTHMDSGVQLKNVFDST